MGVTTQIESRLGVITQQLLEGKVVPLLGAGANLCGRQPVNPWAPKSGLPSGSELADYLIEALSVDPSNVYPPTEPRDLVRVSQFVTAVLGERPLHDQLHKVFGQTYQPNEVHRFLARLPSLTVKAAQARDEEVERPMIVTTNYDDALEQAFNAAGEPYDLVSYISDGSNAGKFFHRRPDGTGGVIKSANSSREFSFADRTVIVKLHGAVDRADPKGDSYVITEDDYIEYLARRERIPTQLLAKMNQSHFLFLGYGLRDWNLRVILYRIWEQERLGYNSWAVQLAPSQIDQQVWADRAVEILDAELGEFVQTLSDRLTTAANKGQTP